MPSEDTPRTPRSPTRGRPPATRLPALGSRGEGWVALQGALLALVFLAGLAGPAWAGPGLAVARVVGVALVALGVTIAVLGMVGLRENLTPVPRPIAGGSLVDHGIYGIVRHPIYTGIIAAAFGWGLLTASPAALVAASLLGVFFDVKARREEAWLVAAYPEYAAYRRRVRKLVPLLY